MTNNLVIINQVIEEHKVIRGHIKLMGDTVADLEALSSLERARDDWVSSQSEILSERKNKLQQTLSSLYEGFKNHFAFEEKALPSLLGELLMQALILDHSEIRREIDGAKEELTRIRPEGLSHEELLDKQAHVRQIINNIGRLVEEHVVREVVLLEMVRRALEKKG
jgi:hemerythrin